LKNNVDARGDDRKLQLLVDSIIDYAIYMIDLGGHVQSWNAGARRLKGYAPEEVIGRSFENFYTPEDRAAGTPKRALAVARETGRFNGEGWRVRKDGSRFWALVVLDAVRDETGELIGFAKVTRDITERQEAQERQLESERRYGRLVEAVVDYVSFSWTTPGWSRPGTRVPSVSRDTTRTRSSDGTFRNSTRPKIVPRVFPPVPWTPLQKPGATRPRGGGSARTAAGSGPRW